LALDGCPASFFFWALKGPSYEWPFKNLELDISSETVQVGVTWMDKNHPTGHPMEAFGVLTFVFFKCSQN
jgi:hypothetical protein